MPRDASGTYTLPSGVNPTVGGTTITTAWANTTLQDLRDAMTGSLSRTGLGGMSAPLKLANGAVGAPALTFTTEANSGIYRDSAGFFSFAIGGLDAWKISNSGSLVLFTVGTVAATPSRIVIDGTIADAILRYNGVNNCEWRTNGTLTFLGTISASDLVLESNSTSRLYLKSGGSLRLHQDTTDIPGAGNTTVGGAIEAGADGDSLLLSRTNNVGLFVNRNADGAVASFGRLGVSVGTIAVSVGATAYNTSSDLRLKTAVEDSYEAGAMLDAIRVVRHGWKQFPDAWVPFGVVAQELFAVHPSAVTQGGDDLDDYGLPTTPWGVDPSKLVFPLVKEIQSLRKRVAQLEQSP